MRKLSAYEWYLHEQTRFFFYCEDEKNDFPDWLDFERSAFYWMFRLSRKIMGALSDGGTLSLSLQEQMKNAPTNRRLRYRCIAPVLKEALSGFAAHASRAYEKIRCDGECWISKCTLSKKGRSIFTEEIKGIEEYESVRPDHHWRLLRERELAYPGLSRYDAYDIAKKAVEKEYGICVNDDIDCRDQVFYRMALFFEDNILTAALLKHTSGTRLGSDVCTVTVDMNTGEYRIEPEADDSTSFFLRWEDQSEALIDDVRVEELSFVRSKRRITVKKYNGRNELVSREEVAVPKAETEELFRFVSSGVNAGLWLGDHSEGICDGSCWEMLVRCGGKKRFKCSGDAGYPSGGPYLEKLLSGLLKASAYPAEELHFFGACVRPGRD